MLLAIRAAGRVKLDPSIHIRGGFYRQFPKTKLARFREDVRELISIAQVPAPAQAGNLIVTEPAAGGQTLT